MRNIEERQYAMLVRVREFGEAHRGLFPESSIGGQTFAAVAAAVARVSVHAKSKLSTPREGRASKRSARRALIKRLEGIARTARAIADQSPGFDDPFRLPGLRAGSDETVLAVGRAAIRDAEAVKDRFIPYAMPETFVAQLEELVDRFEEAIRGQEAVRIVQAEAQSGIADALAAGFDAVRTLDLLVANHLADDPVATALWMRERRVGYPRRSRSRMAQAAEPANATVIVTEPTSVAGITHRLGS